MTSWLVRVGLVTALVASSGLVLAEAADDMGAPGRHAPRRKAPKKKAPAKPKRARAAGTTGWPYPVDASASTPAAAAPEASAADDEDEDEDEEDAASTDAGAPAPRRPRKRRGDGGAAAGASTTSEDDEDDDEDDDADEDDNAYELGAELAAESRLVWRGLPESRGAVLQSSAWAGLYGLRIEGWASYLLNAEGPFDAMSVVGADLTGSYELAIGDLRIRPGATLLYFPEGLSSSATTEASLGASYRLGEFRIVSGTNVDVRIAPGAYFGTLGMSWGRARSPWTVKALADVGWASAKYNNEYLARNVAAIDVVHAGLATRYDIGDVVYLELHVDMSGLVAPTLSGSVREPILIVGGAAIGLDWSVAK
jgi:hypothetical protein